MLGTCAYKGLILSGALSSTYCNYPTLQMRIVIGLKWFSLSNVTRK